MKQIGLILLLFLVFSCGTNKEEAIIGTWNEVDTGTSELIYRKDHTYTFNYDDGRTDHGTWRIEGDILYTIEEGSDIELEETISTLDEETFVSVIGGMFQTTYKRSKK